MLSHYNFESEKRILYCKSSEGSPAKVQLYVFHLISRKNTGTGVAEREESHRFRLSELLKFQPVNRRKYPSHWLYKPVTLTWKRKATEIFVRGGSEKALEDVFNYF